MELHITGLWYAFPYQNMEFHITKILKEIIAGGMCKVVEQENGNLKGGESVKTKEWISRKY